MPLDNNEELKDEFETRDAPPEPTGEERIRPGLKGMYWKVLLWFAAVGLVPVLLMLPVLFPLAEKSQQIHKEVVDEAEGFRQKAIELERSLADLRKQMSDQKAEEGRKTYEKSARRGFRELLKKLAALISTEKKPEEIAADKSIKTALEATGGSFSEVVLLDASARKSLVTKSPMPVGSLEKTYPVLHKAFVPDKPPATLGIPGWHWAPIANTPYALAVYTPEWKPEAQPPPSAEEKPVAATVEPLRAGELNTFDQRLSRWTWILSIALPLLAVVLMACAFVWLRAGLLAPLSRITQSARTVLESPDQLEEEQLARSGLLEDLAATLNRLAVRMQRLQEQDRLAVKRQNQILAIEQTLSRAVSGDLSSRTPVEPGECETLAMGTNRLLESVTERSEAAVQACSRLKSSSDRLRELAGQLLGTLTPAGADRPWVDPGPLGEILGVQLETLCQRIGEATEGFLQDAPRKWTAEDHDAMTNSMGSSWAGLRILVQRAQETRDASERLVALRQAADVLSTNMAIAAEARSWRRLEELTDDARNFSTSITELFDSLRRDLDDVSRSGDELKETFQQATDLSLQCEKLVGSWERLREDFQRHRKELNRQIEAIRPGVGSLGSDIRHLSQELAEYKKISTNKQNILHGVSETTAELSRTAAEVFSALKKLTVSEPTPAAVTQELVKKQQVLEKAIRKITHLAAEEGIESLSEDARNIIDQIRAAADEAKKRVLGEPEADA